MKKDIKKMDTTYPVCTRLSGEEVAALDELARRYRLTRSQVVEQLLIGNIINPDEFRSLIAKISQET